MKVMSNIKKAFRSSGRGLSLKEFARSLVQKGDEQAEQWFKNKSQVVQRAEKAERKERKGKMLAEMRAARRAAQDKGKKR